MDKIVYKSLIIIYLSLFSTSICKYMEGRLKTSENWAFLARFCFLSGEGQFDYFIEYNEEQGHPNLLLYYDTPDQWHSVYKTSKSCFEKESVLNIQQNQIVNLTLRRGEFSGCTLNSEISNPTVGTTSKLAITTNPTVTESEFEVITSNFTDFYENFTFFDNFTENYDDFNNISSKIVIKRAVPTRNTKIKNNRLITCRNARRFRSSRERWWFVAISNCKGRKGIDVKYRILMTNGPPGDYWHEQFSADEFYILPVLMAFTIAYTMLILAIVICSIELKSRQLLHATYKLFSFSVIVQYFGILLASMTYLQYALNGIGSPNLKMTGLMIMGISEICFLLLLLLIAKGYTVTRGRLSLSTSIKITIFICLYSITYISLFIYETKVFDPGEVLYLYESPAGYGLIILRIFAWCFFIYSTIFTLKKYPEKCNFYYPFNISGTLWFIAGPAFIISANNYIDKWIRESIVYAVLLFISFGGHLMFLLLTMPSVANKNFPYHVRTTQIGVMELSNNTTIEHFNHHVYEPTPTLDQTVIIPLTRRTEEIFGGIYSQHLYTSNFQRRPSHFQPEIINAEGDVTMENVLNWSLAKNVPERPQIGVDAYENHENGGLNENEKDEFNREVPVELFSISKNINE
nr:transmembrane protein 145-like [Onthophagus taurus]